MTPIDGPPPLDDRTVDGPPTLELESLEHDGDSTEGKRVDVGARRRRRQALFVVGIAVVSAAAGIGIGSVLKSPAERAADREPPTASSITVPVERRALSSSLVLAGQVEYEEPTPVRLAGPVGASAGSTQVITRAPQLDQLVNEGDVVAEISGRPVFVLQGALPVFRSLEPGVDGPDVAQLEGALARLGWFTGVADEVYDDATEAAIDAWYQSAGYQSEGPSEDQRKALREADTRVVQAEKDLATAKDNLAKGGTTVSAAERLAAQQEVSRATDGVPAAEQAAKRANDEATAGVATATGLRDAAKISRDAAKTIYDAAAAPGAINPDTEAPYTPSELAVLQSNLADKETTLLNTEQELTRAVTAQADAKAQGDKNVKDAKDTLALARTRLSDLDKPADTTSLRDAVTAAQAVLDTANADRFALQLETGTKVPAGEIVFLPILPSTITSVTVKAGDAAPSTEIATVSSTDTRVTARVSRGDAGLVQSGMATLIRIRDADFETPGTIVSIGEPPTETDPNDPNGGGGGGESGRLQVVVTPDDPTALRDWIGYSARISIAVSSTESEVLAVPVAALFVGPDGDSQVEVERTAATDDEPAVTEIVKVKIGLTAQGFAEITPIDGTLDEGDRVLVGVSSDDQADDESDEADGSA